MKYCPINPMDYINAPAGAFVKAVREYDPDYGRGEQGKCKLTIKYMEIQKKEIRHTAFVEAYTFEEACKSIIHNDGNVIEDDYDEYDYDHDYEDFREVEREECEE